MKDQADKVRIYEFFRNKDFIVDENDPNFDNELRDIFLDMVTKGAAKYFHGTGNYVLIAENGYIVDKCNPRWKGNTMSYESSYADIIPSFTDHDLADEIRTIAKTFNLLLKEADRRKLKVIYKSDIDKNYYDVQRVQIDKIMREEEL